MMALSKIMRGGYMDLLGANSNMILQKSVVFVNHIYL